MTKSATTRGEGDAADLRARLAAVDAENFERARRTNAAVAEAQERTYWLDRWQIDLDRLMRRPGVPVMVRGIRSASRAAAAARRALSRSGGA